MPSTGRPGSPVPVIAVECSRDQKTGPVSATYAPIQSCPDSCPLTGDGSVAAPCYGTSGNCGFHFRRISNLADGLKPAQIADLEAQAIDRLSGYFDLRIHVVGDARTAPAARRLANAAKRYLTKHKNRAVWCYTQAWRSVPRSAWGPIQILASCYSHSEAIRAFEKGYAPAIVFESADHLEVAQETNRDFKIQRCLHELKGLKCYECRLCLNADRLIKRRIAIAFLPHGSGAGAVSRAISKRGGFWK